MKVVLLTDVRGQGKKDQILEVSDGYARNFLLPKKLAVQADAKTLGEIKAREESQNRKAAAALAQAREYAAKLSELSLVIKGNGGADGRLYGSVTNKDIADELLRTHKIEIDKRKISLQDNIKTFGTHTAEVKLYPEVTAKLSVIVTDK